MKFIIPTVSLLLLAPACGHDEKEDEPALVEVQVNQARFEKDRKELVAKSEKQIKNIEHESAKLRDKLGALEGAARVNAEKALETLETRREELADQIARANEQTSAGWDKFKDQVERFSQDLEDAYNSALEKLKTNN